MLQRLILLRHGEAEPRAASGRDLDRELTDAGRAAAAQAGRVLAQAGAAPDLVLVSPATRARRTWAEARAAWPSPPPEREARGLYDQTPAQLLRLAQAAGETAVMLVAHNPGLEALAAELALADPRLARGFPPGSAAVLDQAPDAGRGAGGGWTLSLFHTPAGVEAAG